MTALRSLQAGPSLAVVVLAVPAAILVGALTAVSPVAGIVMIAASGILLLLSLGRRMIPVFQVSLVAILVGYAFLGRGMAYVGVAPVYVGEIVLGLAVVAILVSLPGARWQPIHVALLLFMGWGLVRTLPYVGHYGIDALRDAVSWEYGLFAIAVSLTVRRTHVDALLRLYSRCIPWFVVWVPVAAIVYAALSSSLPLVPGSDVPILVFKGGDAGVQLGAIGAFMILGLRGPNMSAARDWALWAAWLVAVGIAGAINRGGMIAASMMAMSILFVRATTRWFSLVFVGLFLVGVVGLANPEVDIGLARRLSVEQVVSNVLSVFGGAKDDPVLEGTKQWRLLWWTKIIDYTVDGPYFWTGKGYGVNLADEDGFQVHEDGSLRTPHNAHLDLLARGGVPQLALWILLQAAFAIMTLRSAARARAAGLTFWVRVHGWIFVFWLAALVNATFDPYLQGPMGGIWFWSMIGLGIAVTQIARSEIDAAQRPSQPR